MTPWRSRTRTASGSPWSTRPSSRRCGSGGRSTSPQDHEWTVQGNIVDHEYEIEDDGRKIAEVSKKWFRVRDTYGVEIAPGEDAALVLAVTVAIDTMAH